MAYPVVELTKVAAIYGGGHIHSLISDTEVTNGAFGYVGDISEDVDGMETYEFEAPSATYINKSRVVVVANPEWKYDESERTNQALYNYTNEAGKILRAYDLMSGDEIGLSIDGFALNGDAEPKKGDYVILAAGSTKPKIVAASGISGQFFYGKIVGSAVKGQTFTTKGGKTFGNAYTMYYIRIFCNEVV